MPPALGDKNTEMAPRVAGESIFNTSTATGDPGR